MNRLTKEEIQNWLNRYHPVEVCRGDCFNSRVMLELLEYKDTGLAPEEFKRTYEIFQEAYSVQGDLIEAREDNARLRAELAALREQAERSKGCGHCNNKRCTTCCHFGWSPNVCKRCINQDLYKSHPFCQLCGRRLEGERDG